MFDFFKCRTSWLIYNVNFIMSYHINGRVKPPVQLCFIFSLTILSIQIIVSISSLSSFPLHTLFCHHLTHSYQPFTKSLCRSRLYIIPRSHLLSVSSSSTWSLCYHLQIFLRNIDTSASQYRHKRKLCRCAYINYAFFYNMPASGI